MREEEATRLLRRIIGTYRRLKRFLVSYYACGSIHVSADPQYLLLIFFDAIIGASS